MADDEHWYRLRDEQGVNVLALALPVAVDFAEFDRINEQAAGMVARAADGRWVVDLTEVDYIGSAILGLLVNLRQRILAGGGKLVLCGLSAELARAVHACSLHNLFVIVERADDAVRRVASAR